MSTLAEQTYAIGGKYALTGNYRGLVHSCTLDSITVSLFVYVFFSLTNIESIRNKSKKKTDTETSNACLAWPPPRHHLTGAMGRVIIA